MTNLYQGYFIIFRRSIFLQLRVTDKPIIPISAPKNDQQTKKSYALKCRAFRVVRVTYAMQACQTSSARTCLAQGSWPIFVDQCSYSIEQRPPNPKEDFFHLLCSTLSQKAERSKSGAIHEARHLS